MARFLQNGPTVDVWFCTGWNSVVMGFVGGPCILAIRLPQAANTPLIEIDNVRPEECEVFYDPDKYKEALAQAYGAMGLEGSQIPAPPERPGCAFVAVKKDRAEFRVRVNTEHPTVLDRRAGEVRRVELTVGMIPMPVVNASTAPSWDPLPNLLVVLNIRGERPIFPRAFAIDFGTTATCAAFMDGNPPEPKLFYYRGADSIPTVLSYLKIPPNGKRVCEIGRQAVQRDVEGDLRCLVRGMKRYLGMDGVPRMHEVAVNGAVQFLHALEAYSDFAETYLRRFEEDGRVRLRRVKATYPPDYPSRAKMGVMQIYQKLGMDPACLFGIDEASAAALYYLWLRLKKVNFNINVYRGQYGDSHNLLVFDIGGGTTDVSMVCITVQPQVIDGRRTEELSFKVLGTASMMCIGGDNFTIELLKAIKCRIAMHLAAQNNQVGEKWSDEVKNALAAIRARLSDFQELFNPDSPWSEEQQILQAELEQYADRVLPTAWSRFEGAQGGVFKRATAMNTFNVLWHIAEDYKIQLCNQEKLALEETRFAGGLCESLNALVPPSEWENIVLDREVDLYRRIRPLLAKAVRACRQVTVSYQGETRQVNSIQLVGNSSRIPLLKQLMVQEFRDQPMIEDIIHHETRFAKSAVSLGACLAAHLKDFGQTTRIRLKFEGLDDCLGWEIGEWRTPDPFQPYFHPSTRLAANPKPTVLIRDEDQMEVQLYRRRPRQPDPDPEYLGSFLLDQPGKPVDTREPVPPGRMRLVLVGPEDVRLVRGQQFWELNRPRVRIDPKLDPFSGVH